MLEMPTAPATNINLLEEILKAMSSISISNPSSAPAEEMISVLIVEDHLTLAEALQVALTQDKDIKVEAVAGTIVEARSLLRKKSFKIALVDVQLPDGNGLSLADEILHGYPEMRVIVVTAQEDRPTVNAALKMGCHGYISKKESFSHVVGAIKGAMSGTTVLSPKMAAFLLQRPESSASEGLLTKKEVTILQLLAEGKSSVEIAETLFIATHTLRNYLNHINEKLDTHSKLEAVSKAVKLGVIEMEGPVSVAEGS